LSVNAQRRIHCGTVIILKPTCNSISVTGVTSRLELVVIKVETGRAYVTVTLVEYSALVLNITPITVLTGC